MDKIKFIQLLLIFIISAAFPCNYKSLELNLKNGNTNEEYEVDITLENMHLCIDKVICRKTNEEHDIIDAKIMIPGKKDYRFQKNAWIQTAAETSVKEEDMQALAKEKDRPCFSRGCASLLKHEKGEKIGKIELPFPSEIKENLKNSTVMIKSSLKDACLQIMLKLDNPFYNTESKILESSGSNLEKCLFSGLEPEGFAEELKEGCVHFRNLLKLTVDSYIKKTDASEKTSEMENISFQEAKSAGIGNICFIAQAVNYSSSKYAWLKKTSITDYAAKGNLSYEKRQKTVPYPEENTDAKTIAELEECQDLEKTRKLLSGIVPGDIVSCKDGAEILFALVSGMDREKIENASNADELYEGIFVMESINEKHECGVKKHDLSKIMARGEKSCSIKRLCIF